MSARCTRCNLIAVSVSVSLVVRQSIDYAPVSLSCNALDVIQNYRHVISETMNEIERLLSKVVADMRQYFRVTSLKDMNMVQLLHMKKIVSVMAEALECEIKAVIKHRSSDSDDSDSASDTESLGGEEYRRPDADFAG
jgi:hypothetical protein